MFGTRALNPLQENRPFSVFFANSALKISVFSFLGLAACNRAEPAPAPTFEPLFPTLSGELMTNSSPNLIDLTGDGILDIVFGSGVDRLRPSQGRYVFSNEPAVPGYVTAVSGATNDVIWKVPNPGEAFTTPRFADLNGDRVMDVIMGGREGAFTAYNGGDGSVIWRLSPADVAKTPVPYNFFTPALIRDANDDGVPDLVVVYGGDDTKLPGEPRAAGYITAISGADGAVFAVHETPDGNESYASTVVYERSDGTEWVVFGTGGETHAGAAYRAPVASLVDGSFVAHAEELVPPGEKGVMAPATLVELTGDGELDIVISTFDGRLIAVSGSTRETLWQQRAEGEEAYHPAAVVRIAHDGRLGLFVSRGIGVFPRYGGTVHRLHDATDGRILYEYKDPQHPSGAPLAVDLTGDGIDEPFFFSMRYPTAQGGRIHIYHIPSRGMVHHDIPTNVASTPAIADPRATGTLELILLSWNIDAISESEAPSWRNLRSHLMRLDLSAATPEFRGWAAYMGTATDGHYRTTADNERE
jgi:outer membrane protein assembly factor BamB